MIPGYTKNLSVQILIKLLIEHGIKKVIISPGGTNLEFAAALQYSGAFKLYSSVDERSAAYMACGMAHESGEPVVITCTEATASRNYYPGLTEAFYRKLPILAVTGVHRYSQIGHLFPQIIDRSHSPDDVFTTKVHLPVIKDQEDKTETELLINKAILNLSRHGGGPVHIDLPCCNNDYNFDTHTLPDVKVIKRYYMGDVIPDLPVGKIAIFIGSHQPFSTDETKVIDMFCAENDSVVFCDHSSGYYGTYAVHTCLLAKQKRPYDIFSDISLLIHLGEAAADEDTMSRLKKVKDVWRVNPDGELRDTFGKLSTVFEMTENCFFNLLIKNTNVKRNSYLGLCLKDKSELNIPYTELPLSNIYIASRIVPELPANSLIHLGLSNTIRAWSLFDLPESICSASNVGCRGIDGVLSSFIGASLASYKKICFCVLGDLTFFYDMNALGNRSIGNNIRILLINNNGGGVFKLQGAPGHIFFGDAETDNFIAAAGHFGNQSETLVKNYVLSLGFDYMKASSKEEFDSCYKRFTSPQEHDKPIIFEVFTSDKAEREAFSIISNLDVSMIGKAKDVAKRILGEKGTTFLKDITKGKR